MEEIFRQKGAGGRHLQKNDFKVACCVFWPPLDEEWPPVYLKARQIWLDTSRVCLKNLGSTVYFSAVSDRLWEQGSRNRAGKGVCIKEQGTKI